MYISYSNNEKTKGTLYEYLDDGDVGDEVGEYKI